MQDNIGYKESLLRFVKDIGPTAQIIAWQKLERCATEVHSRHIGSPLHELQIQEYQIPNAASVLKNKTAASSLNFLKNSSGKNLSGKVNILGNMVYTGKASMFDATNTNDVLSRGFAQPSNTTRNPVNYNGKSVQTLRDVAAILKQNMAGQGNGNPYFPTSSFGGGNQYLSCKWSTSGNYNEYISSTINKGKNVQMDDASSSYIVRNPVAPHRRPIQATRKGAREEGTAFNENVGDQGTWSSDFPTAMLEDHKSYLSATSNTYNDPDKSISGAGYKGKDVEMAEANSLYPMEHSGGSHGKSVQGMRQKGAVSNADMTDLGSGCPYFSTDLFGAFSATQTTHSSPDKSISPYLNKGKNVLVAEVNSLDASDPDDYDRKSVQGMRDFGASFKAGMSDQSIGSSFFSIPLHIVENSYFPAPRHTYNNTGGRIANAIDKSWNDQMAEMTSSDPRTLESLPASHHGAASSKSRQWLPPAVDLKWSQAQPTRGLDLNHLGGGVQDVQSMASIGGTNNESKLVQAGKAWNWFKPTQLRSQPILSSSFLWQSRPDKVDLAGQAGTSQWGGWGTTAPNVHVVEGSFVNGSHQTSNQQGDLTIGAPLVNNSLPQSPSDTKCHQPSPLANNFWLQSPLGNNYQQQSPLESNYRQHSNLENDHWQQSPLANNNQRQSSLGSSLQQQSPLASNYRWQSSLGNNYQLQSPSANGKQQQSPLASNYQQQSSLGNNNQQKSSVTNKYQQQSPMMKNHQRQSPLGGNYRQQSPLAGNNYQHKSPLSNNHC